jgi:xanthosine utilization system XapX-like protein
MTARSNHLKVLTFALAAIVAVGLLALVVAKKPAEATFSTVTGNNLMLPSHRVELVNPVLGKSPPKIYVMSAHSTERTDITNKFGMDNHAVVVARWHKDFLRLRKLSQQ